MGYFPSFSTASKHELLEESDFFDRLDTTSDPGELKNLLKEGQQYFASLGRFGLADKVSITEPNQALNLKIKL